VRHHGGRLVPVTVAQVALAWLVDRHLGDPRPRTVEQLSDDLGAADLHSRCPPGLVEIRPRSPEGRSRPVRLLKDHQRATGCCSARWGCPAHRVNETAMTEAWLLSTRPQGAGRWSDAGRFAIHGIGQPSRMPDDATAGPAGDFSVKSHLRDASLASDDLRAPRPTRWPLPRRPGGASVRATASLTARPRRRRFCRCPVG
jgi:hypothetical protein